MTDLKSMTIEELTEYMQERGEGAYRARQLFSWIHEKTAISYDSMTNLPRKLRDGLPPLTQLQIVQVQKSQKDATRKYLFALADGNLIESVYMKYRFGSSVCISSQVGCRMGCAFCASTIQGVVRNLTASEMLEQVYQVQREVGVRISHVVIMGSGEPMENQDQVLRFLSLICDPRGQNLSTRHLTVSTCGIVPGILRFAEEKLQINLAISLHAPTQEKRQTLMPVARQYDLNALMQACKVYFQKTGRQITFEYALIAGKNDTASDARQLSDLLKGFPCLVNLIPMNPVRERSFQASSRATALSFQKILEKNGINVTIRREMGQDIDGACGQLRRRVMTQQI